MGTLCETGSNTAPYIRTFEHGQVESHSANTIGTATVIPATVIHMDTHSSYTLTRRNTRNCKPYSNLKDVHSENHPTSTTSTRTEHTNAMQQLKLQLLQIEKIHLVLSVAYTLPKLVY